MVLVGDTDPKQTFVVRPFTLSVNLAESVFKTFIRLKYCLYLHIVEYNISGTRKEKKRKSTPSLKFGVKSVLCGEKYIGSSHRFSITSHLQIAHELISLKFTK